jgi:2,4-dienoyl-CoA reductase-like NADH-dependent reductase (Old Yellow Enzyme family)
VREAGFDGVQIHGAHGYLTTQFLTPKTNLRQDRWGGNEGRRSAFLKAIAAEVRRQVGPDYPVWIKLGVAGSEDSGLDMEEGARVANRCTNYAIDCIEISFALGRPEWMDLGTEAPLFPLADAVRDAVGPDYPLGLVYGFRTRQCMETVLNSGVVQMISLCRPLIAEPDLVHKMEQGLSDEVACTRCDLCRSGEDEEGIVCRNEAVQQSLA